MFLKKFVYRLRGEYTTEDLVKRGMKIGENFVRLNEVILDPDHCWLIEIGSNVTLAPRVHILCHDASTKNFLNFTKVGRVTIGDNVFIGASSVILPGVKIGNNVIVGANSTVSHDIPDNCVVAGAPIRIISTMSEYLKKEKKRMANAPIYGEEFTLRGNVTMERRMEQKDSLADTIGYII